MYYLAKLVFGPFVKLSFVVSFINNISPMYIFTCNFWYTLCLLGHFYTHGVLPVWYIANLHGLFSFLVYGVWLWGNKGTVRTFFSDLPYVIDLVQTISKFFSNILTCLNFRNRATFEV